MNIVIYPNWTETNPYLNLLCSALRESGNKVIITDHLFKNKFLDRPDVINVHWVESESVAKAFKFLFNILLVKIRGVKVCWTIHNLKPHSDKNALSNKIVYLILFQIADLFIVMSKWEKNIIEELSSIDGTKVKVVPHGNYSSHYKNNCSRDEAKKRLNISKNAFVYLFFGIIREYKGVIELLEVFTKVKRKCDILLIAGTPEKSLEKKILEYEDDSVHAHLGFVEEKNVQYFFNAADICVFPYREITNSGSVTLAFSFSRPVICPKLGSLREIVKPDFGILYELGGLSKALKEARNKNLEEMGLNAYKYSQTVSWESIAKKYTSAYALLLLEQSLKK